MAHLLPLILELSTKNTNNPTRVLIMTQLNIKINVVLFQELTKIFVQRFRLILTLYVMYMIGITSAQTATIAY